MSQRDGFTYYYDYLGLEPENLLIQYDSGVVGNYSGIGHPELGRGSLAFPQEISGATGMNRDEWTHLFVYNKTGSGQGILFSSLQGSYPYSGYVIGLTDDNKTYFETYDNNGPVVRVGGHINSSHNAMAVTLGSNNVSFSYFDFDRQQAETESFQIQTNFVLPHTRAFVGGSPALPSYTSGKKFPGTIDTYIYVASALAPDSFNSLFSGFYSYYDYAPGPVSGTDYQEITGYNPVPYGHVGVTGYQTTSGVIGTGQDGSLIYQYNVNPLSGFILDGTDYQPVTGIVTVYTTGDPTYQLIVDSNFVNEFMLDRVTLLNAPKAGDLNFFYGAATVGAGDFNLQGDFNYIEGNFDLQDVYNDQEVQIYLNGSGLGNDGYDVTGNIYGSGYRISGDYILNGFEVMTKKPVALSYPYLPSGLPSGTPPTYLPLFNTLIYDYIPSGQKLSVPFVSHASGDSINNLPVTPTSLVFVDGDKLDLGVDYRVTAGKVQFLTNHYAGYQGTGIISSFAPPADFISASGVQFGDLTGYQRDTSRVFHNGSRLILGQDYVENSRFDFLKRRTIVETGLNLLYNGEDQYFQ